MMYAEIKLKIYFYKISHQYLYSVKICINAFLKNYDYLTVYNLSNYFILFNFLVLIKSLGKNETRCMKKTKKNQGKYDYIKSKSFLLCIISNQVIIFNVNNHNIWFERWWKLHYWTNTFVWKSQVHKVAIHLLNP